MTNPYQAPQSTVEQQPGSAGGRGAVWQFMLGLICALSLAVAPIRLVPAFQAVFDSFGAQLPLLTRFFLGYHGVLWLLPLLVVLARCFWPQVNRRALVACLIGVTGLLVLLPLMVVAMYLPIFQLGVVGN